MSTLPAEERIHEALRKVAYEPFGDAEASDKEVLQLITEFARAELKGMPDPIPAPIQMLLWCPECHERHIDRGDFAHKPHHTHACQNCGMTWRPAIVATTGVLFLPGFKDRGEP